MMRSVLCIAQVCCDLIFGGLPHIPSPGGEVFGNAFCVKTGGGANTAISLARLGVPTAMLTCIGDDLMGQSVLHSMRSAGVNLLGKLCEPGYETDVSAVLSTPQDRCFASYSAPPRVLFEPQTLESAIRNCEIVHTYPGYCVDYPILDLAQRYGKLVSMDMSRCDAQNAATTMAVLERVDHLKLNEAEACILTGEDSAERALAQLAKTVRKGVVVTCGKDGCIAMDGKTVLSPKCYAQSAVVYGPFCDACGAGDNFSAGMLRALADGKSLPQAIIWGSHIAGQAVTWLGGNDVRINCTKIDC